MRWAALAGGVAHDFNNLLTVIKGNSSLLLEKLQPGDPFLGYTRQIESAADRAASLTRQLLAFCRMQVLQPKILDLNALVSEMCKLLRRLTREDIAFNFHAGQSLGRVKADPGQIEQVIMNLVVNAGDAMPAGGTLTIETHNMTVDEQSGLTQPPILPGEYVLLTVTDTGQGMDANTKARIFEPFFTTPHQTESFFTAGTDGNLNREGFGTSNADTRARTRRFRPANKRFHSFDSTN
jgi:signal transduction histidine kinase